MGSNWKSRIDRMMARTGLNYRQCCQKIGAAGGRKAAANKRRRTDMANKFHGEQKRQVAMHLREPDEVLSEQDKISMVFDQQKARVT